MASGTEVAEAASGSGHVARLLSRRPPQCARLMVSQRRADPFKAQGALQESGKYCDACTH